MKYLPFLSALAAVLSACTAAEQTAETSAPSAGPARPVPTAVNSDADRRAIYEGNGGRPNTSATPDATPNAVRLGEQASDINSRKRVETLGTNDPNNATPETRLQRLDNDPVPIIPPARTRQDIPPATR